MQSELRRRLYAPFHYWRTILLVPVVGLLVAMLFQHATAVLLATLGCAFVFSGYERRHWITMPEQLQAGDIVLRISLAFAVTYAACSTQVSALFHERAFGLL